MQAKIIFTTMLLCFIIGYNSDIHANAKPNIVNILASPSIVTPFNEIVREFSRQNKIMANINFYNIKNAKDLEDMAILPDLIIYNLESDKLSSIFQNSDLNVKKQIYIISNKLAVVEYGQKEIDSQYSQQTLKELLIDKFKNNIGILAKDENTALGAYTKEVLQSLNMWNEAKDQSIFIDNSQLVVNEIYNRKSFGITYISDVKNNPLVRVISVIPTKLHEDIAYKLIILNNNDNVKKFIKFLNSTYSHDIFRKYGLVRN